MSRFYCQLDYEHVPYLSPVGAANGNISNNGCGVCSASMVAENMLGVSFPPEAAARFAKMCGARETWGTNLYVLAPAFAAHMGMTVRDTEDAGEALRFLQEKRGMVIANTQGDRESDGYIGVFSNGGHYVVIAEAEGTTVKVWDPMYREGSGRYDIPGRRGKVRLDGTDAYADMSVLREDCRDRSFFLFEKRPSPAPAPMIGVIRADGLNDRSAADRCMRAVLNAGGVPLLLEPDMPCDMLRGCVARLNGLFISLEAARTCDADSAITDSIRFCREMNKPVLAAGGGLAHLIAAMGGNTGGAITCFDRVSTLRGTRMEVVTEPDFSVNACEDIALSDIPEGMRACASDPEGRLRAAECCEGALCLGVSWHPEDRFQGDDSAKALFRALVESARV